MICEFLEFCFSCLACCRDSQNENTEKISYEISYNNISE